MIFEDSKFNKQTDICEVDQFGYVNLRMALVDGVIPGNVTINENAYNEIEDLGSIVGKPHDIFEAMQYGVSLDNNNRMGDSSPKGEAE